MRLFTTVSALALAISAPALAHEPDAIRADGHAPIGVMGDHTHEAGEWMFSYRFMRMEMEGNRIGTRGVTPAEIVTSVANVNGPPATLRVVPTDMTMDMHMLGAMYAPNDRVTVMMMVNYLQNEMIHTTFAGMMGASELGRFTTRSEGFGDVKLSALFGVVDTGQTRLNLQAGLSLPTGSTGERARVLTPMGTTPTLVMPYPMQLGTGSYDPMLAATLTHQAGHWTFGGQASATLRVQDNDSGYRVGDVAHVTSWAGWSPMPSWAFFGRLEARSQGMTHGFDARFAAPVQTANPAFLGGDTVLASLGVNWVGQSGALRGQRIAAELSRPVYQDLNGPQMERDWALTLGWQYAWGGGQQRHHN
ncbi:transporter [Maricaulis sp.]|uniref:transporter n=1 Tax=Maricaulis sp. TaxID=1486257 RepID=UPI002B264AF6|nr:transporter [Maricaulis sp.]